MTLITGWHPRQKLTCLRNLARARTGRRVSRALASGQMGTRPALRGHLFHQHLAVAAARCEEAIW